MLETVEPSLLPLLAERLRALGDPLRLRLMQLLSEGPQTVGELVAATGATQPNVSRHLARLEQAGWVTRQREGSHVRVRVADDVGDELCRNVCALVRKQAAKAADIAGVGEEGASS